MAKIVNAWVLLLYPILLSSVQAYSLTVSELLVETLYLHRE